MINRRIVFTKEQEKVIKTMLITGVSMAVIGERFCCSDQRIMAFKKDNGIKIGKSWEPYKKYYIYNAKNELLKTVIGRKEAARVAGISEIYLTLVVDKDKLVGAGRKKHLGIRITTKELK